MNGSSCWDLEAQAGLREASVLRQAKLERDIRVARKLLAEGLRAGEVAQRIGRSQSWVWRASREG